MAISARMAASMAKAGITSSKSAPAAGSVGATTTNAAGQKINSAEQVVGGAVTSSGLSYGTGTIPGRLTSSGSIAPITKSNLEPVASAILPEKPAPAPVVTEAFSTLSPYSVNPADTVKANTAATTPDVSFTSMLEMINEGTPKQQSGVQAYTDTYGMTPQQATQRAIAAEENLNSIKAQLNAVNTQANTDILNLRGIATKEGVTEAVYGGQAAEVARIAALRGLPLAAELEIAQGNLARAEKHLDRLFEVKMADNKADYEYRVNRFNAVMTIATQEQKNQLGAKIRAEERRYELLDKETSENRALTSALLADQPQVALAFSELDPNSKTYLADKRKLMAQVKPDDLKRLQREKLKKELEAKVNDFTFIGKDKFDRERDLSKDFTTRSGDYRKAAPQIAAIRASYNDAIKLANDGKSINAASQGVLVSFQKLLDPTSVVRESEYARSAAGLSLVSRLEGFKTKLEQGGAGVSADDLKEFVNTAETFLRGYEDSAITDAQLIIEQATGVGLDINNIIPKNVLELMDARFAEAAKNTPIGGIVDIGGVKYKKIGDDNFEQI
jgi:hypothetical protein